MRFVIGDVACTPFGKIAASVQIQAPVVEANLLSFIAGKELLANYNGLNHFNLSGEGDIGSLLGNLL